MYTSKLVTPAPSEGPRVAPSGAVVEQVVLHMGCILNPLGAGREIVLSWPGTCPQRQEVELFHLIPQPCRAPGEKHFSVTPMMDLLLFLKRVYLGTHRRQAASCCTYDEGKQGRV